MDKIEDVWKIEAPKYGMSHESYMTFDQDKVFFSYRLEGAVNGGTEQIVHKDTGIALEFERYTYVEEKRTGYHLKICDTNVSGVLAPWYITYWYLIVLLAAVAFFAFAGLLKGWYRKGKSDG